MHKNIARHTRLSNEEQVHTNHYAIHCQSAQIENQYGIRNTRLNHYTSGTRNQETIRLGFPGTGPICNGVSREKWDPSHGAHLSLFCLTVPDLSLFTFDHCCLIKHLRPLSYREQSRPNRASIIIILFTISKAYSVLMQGCRQTKCETECMAKYHCWTKVRWVGGMFHPNGVRCGGVDFHTCSGWKSSLRWKTG